jgi:hypothetical protein
MPSVPLRLERQQNMLIIAGGHLPGETIPINYLEAYCRPGSTNRDWQQTVIPHQTQLVSRKADGTELRLECRLADGVQVTHLIRAGTDEIDFQLEAWNPTTVPSQAHWAQPCLRVGGFTGQGDRQHGPHQAYMEQCFIFLAGRLTLLPTPEWATQAFYTPGQVWCPAHVPRQDVNPRPLSPLVPSNGLIGCFSADRKLLLATAWEPYQELFQGVALCIHSDFRIGGLEPGEKKQVRGKLYILPNDPAALLERYQKDFPEHCRGKNQTV